MKMTIPEIDITIVALKIANQLALLGIQVGSYHEEAEMYEKLIIKMEDYYEQILKRLLEDD